ncbi:MAG: zinc ribbon domain-containing protein [Dehalococcoidia bacterium]
MFDSWESSVALVAAVLIAYGVVLWLGTIVWTYRDIRERTQDGWSQTVSILLVVLFNIPGLVLYLILRPGETLTEAYERRLEAEALMRDLPEPRPACPSCQRTLSDDYLACPYCRTQVKAPCSSCARALELSWVICPYCAAPGPQATAATARSQAAQPPSAPPSPQSTRTTTPPTAASARASAPPTAQERTSSSAQQPSL